MIRKNAILKISAMMAAMVLVGMFATGCGTQEQAPMEETTQAVVEETTAATDAQQTEAPQQTTDASGQDVIGEEKALQIALQDAGKAETEVGYPNIHLDYDDGIQKYEVRFVQDNTEWEYDIDAKTGAILEKDIDNALD